MKSKLLLAVMIPASAVLVTSLVETQAAKSPALPVRHDWPQWYGPNHDNLSTETGLLKTWPQGGPKLLWTSEAAGIGYSGLVVVGERLYTEGYDGKSTFVTALDTRTGNKVWSTRIGPFEAKNHFGCGADSTPTVDGEYLYALSSTGSLVCLKTDKGEKVWSVNLTGTDGLGGERPEFGYCESPLVDGDQVVCSPGGAKGTLAALAKKTGKVLWRSKDLTDTAKYSSIVPSTVGGVRQYVQHTLEGVAGVAAKDGRLLWHYPLQLPGRIHAVSTPMVKGNEVYVSINYNTGSILLKLTPNGEGMKAEQVYDKNARRLLDPAFFGIVLVGDYVYGWSDNRGWTCQEFTSGKKMWQSKKLGPGSVTGADGHLYCCTEEGTVALVVASPKGWQEKGRFSTPRKSAKRDPHGGIWTNPVVANGRLYLRDRELIFCYDVKGDR